MPIIGYIVMAFNYGV